MGVLAVPMNEEAVFRESLIREQKIMKKWTEKTTNQQKLRKFIDAVQSVGAVSFSRMVSNLMYPESS